MFKCPSCGGHMVFDIPSQLLKCEYCDTTADPLSYSEDNEAEESDFFGATVYTCPNCGAELISPDASATGFCMYCGAESVMEGRFTQEKKPEIIIPFRISKDDCKKAYSERTRRAMYAPKEFRDPEFLERFRGIYIPYWLYRVSFRPEVSLPAVKTYRKGDYVYTENYTHNAKLRGDVSGVPFDASSDFDDTIAEGIAPFHRAKMVPFRSSYLAGFYADTANVTRDVYGAAAEEWATDKAWNAVSASLKESGLSLASSMSEAEKRSTVDARSEGGVAALFPVWFLTWRRKDRVAYAVVNGETGRVSADLPVDLKRYFMFSGLTALAVFIVLSLFVTMMPATALLVSASLAALSLWLFLREMTKIHDRENHIFDRGYFVEERQTDITAQEAEQIRSKRRRGGAIKQAGGALQGKLMTLFVWLAVTFGIQILVFAGSVASEFSAVSRARLALFPLVIMGAVCFLQVTALMPRLKDRSPLIEALTALAAIAAAFVIATIDPVSDWIYYAGCIACLAGVCVTCIGLIRRYNIMATRAVPSLFSRKGGNDSAKD